MGSTYQAIGSGYQPAGQGYVPIQSTKPTAKQSAVARTMAPMIQHSGFGKNGRPFSRMIAGQETPESVAFAASDFDAAKAKKKASAVEMPTTPPGMQQPNAVAGANPGNNVPGRFGHMMESIKARADAGKTAVATERANQVANPAATVDRSRAAMANQLAQDGITDLGGGTKTMRNKHGTGFAQRLTPEQFANRAPAVIRDEKGTVDVVAMMANRGKSTTTPYVPGSQATPALNMDAVDANRAAIAAMTASAIPGAGARLAKDRANQVASYAFGTSGERVALAEQAKAQAKTPSMLAAKTITNVTDAAKKALPQLAAPGAALTPPPAVMAAQPAGAAPAPQQAAPQAPSPQAPSPLTPPPPAEGTWQYGAQRAKAKADARAALPKQQADEYDTSMGHLFALAEARGIDITKAMDVAAYESGASIEPNAEFRQALTDSGFNWDGEAIANQLGTGRAITNAELLRDLHHRTKSKDWPKFAERLRGLAKAPAASPLTQPPRR
jgi:hypothetical protein